MQQHHRGFTLVELAFILVVLLILAAVLLSGSAKARIAAGVQGSIDRLRRITGAAQVYHLDNAGQVPLRGCRYSSGNLVGGWDNWEVGGKNCNVFWQGDFDESAYSRPLNAYVYAGLIPLPAGYVNTGSGSTWNFNHGAPTPQDRMNLQIPVFQSPGDRFSYQGSDGIPYGAPNPNRSGYDDVGTSYLANMAWWDDPTLPGGFGSPRFNEGTRRIGLAFSGANPSYIWAGDQTMDLAASLSGRSVPGEWGKPNASVVAFADGRVLYTHLDTGAHSGPGYTLWP